MGGYGAAVVNGVVSAGGVVVAAASGAAAGAAAKKARTRSLSLSSDLNPIEYVWSRLRSDAFSETGDLSTIQDTSTQAVKAMACQWNLVPVDATIDQDTVHAMQQEMVLIIKDEGQNVNDMYSGAAQDTSDSEADSQPEL